MKNNLSLGWCILCMAVFWTVMPASSIKAQALQEKVYSLDSLENLVNGKLPQVDTYDTQEFFKTFFGVIDQEVTPKEWADRMKADLVSNMFDGFCTDNMNMLYDFYMENAVHAPDSLRNKVKSHHDAMVKKYGHLFKGQPAPPLTFTDKNGKQLSLASFKGQILLVDIWGTWCVPCIEEMPYLAALQKEYANRKDVRIMSIACDKKAERWKAFLAKHPTTWHQYLVTPEGNKTLDSVYFCMGIPRFIIIGKDGNLISADAMRPSEKEFGEYFKKITNQ